EPWGQYVAELEREVAHEPTPPLKAVYLHEMADVLRMSGDLWRPQAFALDQRALSFHALYGPAMRARLVEYRRSKDLAGYRDELSAAVKRVEAEPPGEARDGLLADLLIELGLFVEEEGDRHEAKAHYVKATGLRRHNPFFFINLARIFAASGDLDGLWEALAATAALGEESAEALRALKGAMLADVGELLRRAGRVSEAREVYREALMVNPSQLESYRGLELLAWQADDTALEVEGVGGHLALLVHEGAHLDRTNDRRVHLKRKAAGRFYQLARLQEQLGDRDTALVSMHDALGVHQEALYVRAWTRMAQRAGDHMALNEGLTRQIALAQGQPWALLWRVEQASSTLATNAGPWGQAHELLVQCLEEDPNCLPAFIALRRWMLQGSEATLLLHLWADQGREEPQRAWQRGVIHEHLLHDPTAALGEYLTALERAPVRTDGGEQPWERAAERMLLLHGSPEELTALYDQVLEHCPEGQGRRQALQRAARQAEQSGLLERAIAFWLEALDGVPVDPERLEALAHLYRELGWLDEARELFEEVAQVALEKEQFGPAERGLRWWAALVEEAGRHTEAATVWEQVLELCPGDPSALEAQRESLLRSGDYGRLTDLLEAQADRAEDPVRRQLLWMEAAELCLERLRDRRRGHGLLRRVLDQSPSYLPAWDRLEESLRTRRLWD
ncbi:MAG: hypothetical protein AAFX99_31220, partial [Myxococcota bacterium]